MRIVPATLGLVTAYVALPLHIQILLVFINIKRLHENCLCVSHYFFAFDDPFIEGNKCILICYVTFGFAFA